MKNARGMIHLAMFALVAAATVGGATPALAEKMSPEIHTVVIEKLEQALKNTKEDENTSLKPTRARLADLYAERARLRAMDEAAKNCQDCTGAIDDRKSAIAMYGKVLNEAPKEERGSLMLQMAQMHELNNEPRLAEALYERIVAEGPTKHSKSVLAEGYIGRAETRFGKGDVDGAQRDFESALKLVSEGRKGAILHRIAWCYLNKGQQGQAVRTLVHILETPELLTHDTEEGATFDASFQEDVTRDLATFFARGEVTQHETAQLESLAPERAKKDILKHFASECERLGQKKAAIDIWVEVAKYEKKTSEHLEVLVRVTQIRFDLNEKKEALAGLQEVSTYWKQKGCDDAAECQVLQERVKALVVGWNRMEKKAPTAMLADAYYIYVVTFPGDVEMTEWAAESARIQKRYAQAAVLFHEASVLASKSTIKDAKTILETALVGEIEMAELSKDKTARENAYNHYLALNPQGAIASKIWYQRAHVAYERGDMVEASKRFHDYVLSADCRVSASSEVGKLCIQAADLDLDSLVGLKQHAIVQSRALEYSRLLPSRQAEYGKISRTAVLKQAETDQPEVALAKLNEADLTGATPDERIRIFKTRIAAAERAHDLAEVRRSATLLAGVKGLSESDREFSLSKIAWASEMSLDFAEAFRISKQMKLSELKPADRDMKLALLAELAGSNPRSYEEDFLRVSHDNNAKALLRAKIVRDSHNPAREFKTQQAELSRYPSIYAALVLEIYLKNNDSKFAEKALQVRGVAKDPAGRLLAEQLFMKDFSTFDHQIARQHLNGSSDSIMKRTLNDRLKLLATGEKAANQAIQSRDWSLTLLTLNTLSRENKRLYGEIVALPVPTKLKGVQRTTYVRLVEQSARGYLHRGQEIDNKLAVLWGDFKAEQSLIHDYRGLRPEFRPLVASELRQLSSIAPSSIKRELDDELNNRTTLPSDQEIASARADAKQKPFNTGSLTTLRDLEDKRGRDTMVAYLDARLMKMKIGETR